MNPQSLTRTIFQELETVAASSPLERLPKEEQTRCIIYAAIRPEYRFACVERGYGSVDEGSRIECDIWAENPGQPPVLIEIKHTWSTTKFNNKPAEQFGTWLGDLEKLETAGTDSDRYFILVGFFDKDPMQEPNPPAKSVLANIQRLHRHHPAHRAFAPFSWRDETISYMAVWIWHWAAGETLDYPI